MLSSTIRLAWRNLGRHRRRTLTTGTALAFGICLCVATYGLIDGLNRQLLGALTDLDLGHIQFHQTDYIKQHQLEHTLEDTTALCRRAEQHEEVEAATTRAYGFALLGSSKNSAGVQLVGVDPSREVKVTRLHERISSGHYLSAEPTPWPPPRELNEQEKAVDQAISERAEQSAADEIDALLALDETARPQKPGATSKALSVPSKSDQGDTQKLANKLSPPPKRPPQLVLGASLANVLGVKVGSELFLTTQALDGAKESVFATVAGIYQTGTQLYDRHRAYLHLSDLQRLLHLRAAAHEVALRLKAPEHAPTVAASLRQTIASKELRVRAWNEIRPDLQKLLQLNDVSTALMVFIIFFVATLGVVNTMLMAVFERTRELGMLRAIGMSGRRILWLIVTETLFLVFISSLAGTLLGLGLDIYLVQHGWDLRSHTSGFSIAGLGIEPVIYGVITPRGLIMPTAVLSLSCLLASFYPAWRAARMQPAVGMRET